MSELGRQYQTVPWEAEFPEAQARPFRGVILMEWAGAAESQKMDLKRAASFLSDARHDGFLMVFSGGPLEPEFLESNLHEPSFNVHAVMGARELEFVKDESGRQAIDLDLPQYRYRIFERLVREGMNPVAAHPAAEQAVQDFRVSYGPKIFIVGKSA